MKSALSRCLQKKKTLIKKITRLKLFNYFNNLSESISANKASARKQNVNFKACKKTEKGKLSLAN